MAAERTFQEMMALVRTGDEQAAAELVRLYEPEIRRAVRMRLTDAGLRRVFDSMDVCQSVLANFFVRAAHGQFELSEPSDLLRLLVTMARNKVTDQARRQKADRRDVRRLERGAENLDATVAGDATPSRIVAGRELLAAARAQFSDEERFLADQRAQGRAWADLAEEMGATPEGLRKTLTRALDRISKNLGLEEAEHG